MIFKTHKNNKRTKIEINEEKNKDGDENVNKKQKTTAKEDHIELKDNIHTNEII